MILQRWRLELSDEGRQDFRSDPSRWVEGIRLAVNGAGGVLVGLWPDASNGVKWVIVACATANTDAFEATLVEVTRSSSVGVVSLTWGTAQDISAATPPDAGACDLCGGVPPDHYEGCEAGRVDAIVRPRHTTTPLSKRGLSRGVPATESQEGP
jgi:hypothetical protein